MMGSFLEVSWSRFSLYQKHLSCPAVTLRGALTNRIYQTIPEAHTHFGHTPVAGWIHGLFAVVAIWVCAMFYLTQVSPQPGFDMIAVSIGLTALFILGVMKFNPAWKWSMGAIIQVSVLIALIWGTTMYKLVRLR